MRNFSLVWFAMAGKGIRYYMSLVSIASRLVMLRLGMNFPFDCSDGGTFLEHLIPTDSAVRISAVGALTLLRATN